MGIAPEDTGCSAKWMAFSRRLEVWTVRAEAWTEGSESRQVQTRARRAETRWKRDQLVFSGDRWPGAGSWQSPSLQLLSRAPAPPCCPLVMGSERAAHSISLSLGLPPVLSETPHCGLSRTLWGPGDGSAHKVPATQAFGPTSYPQDPRKSQAQR